MAMPQITQWEHYAQLIMVEDGRRAHGELQVLLASMGQAGWELVGMVTLSWGMFSRGHTDAIEVVFKRPAPASSSGTLPRRTPTP